MSDKRIPESESKIEIEPRESTQLTIFRCDSGYIVTSKDPYGFDTRDCRAYTTISEAVLAIEEFFTRIRIKN
ncbi:MAG: hypothetical protein ACYSOZ_03635 [Planctomycetota bacterium]|jgi:hypothetical protein